MSTSSLDQLELQLEELEASADPQAAKQKFSAPWRITKSETDASPHRERRIIRSAEWNDRGHRLNGFQIGLSAARIVAGIDEGHRTLDQIHDRYIAGRAEFECPKFRQTVDDFRGVDGRHSDDLIEREAQAKELAHHPSQI